jgi:hypothetical protein
MIVLRRNVRAYIGRGCGRFVVVKKNDHAGFRDFCRRLKTQWFRPQLSVKY